MRLFKRAATMVAVLGLTVGCGGGGGGQSDPAAAGGNADTAVTFGGPGGATGDLFKAAIADFEKQTGIKVTYQEGSIQEVYSKVLAGTQTNRPDIDVYYANDASTYTGEAQGVYQPVDESLIPNISQLAPGSLPDNKTGVTLYQTLQVMIYNTDLLKQAGLEPPKSWADMWNADYTKCGLVLAEPHGAAKEWNMMNYVASGGDLYDIDATLAKLTEVENRGEITSVVESAQNVADEVAAGKGCIGSVNQGKVLDSINNGAPLDFTIPDEGTAFLTNRLEVVKDAPHPKAANMLINWLIDLPAQQRFYQDGGWTPANVHMQPATDGTAARIMLPSALGDTKILQPEPAKSDLDAWLKKFQSLVAQS